MPRAHIDFSAQFGGRDAAQKVLHHFKALKLASKRIELPDFPFEKMAFILRVDGSVNEYGLNGLGQPDVSGGDYLPLDIGLPESVVMQGDTVIAAHIRDALTSAPAFLAGQPKQAISAMHIPMLEHAMTQMVQGYETNL